MTMRSAGSTVPSGPGPDKRRSSSRPQDERKLSQRFARNEALEKRLEKFAKRQPPPARSISGHGEEFHLPDRTRGRDQYSSFQPPPDSVPINNATPQALRLRDVFRRMVSRIQVISGMRSRMNSPSSPFASGVRRDSASVATLHITITQPAPAPDATATDPMQLWRFRFRSEWVTDPAGDRYYYWLGCVSLAFIYNAVMVVPRAVFSELNGVPFFYFADYFCDLLYVIDIFVNMFCGHLEEGVMVQEPRKLIRAYFRTAASKLDVLSVIPTDLVLPFTGASAPYPFVRINRVLKFMRFDRFFKRLESRTSYPDFFRMAYLFLTFILMMHLNACLYYHISEKVGVNSDGWVYPADANWSCSATASTCTGSNENDPLHRKYIWSFFWSLQTLTLIGQIKQPEYEGEFTFVLVNFLIGVLIFANIVGNVSRTIANMNLVMDTFRNKMDAVKRYCVLRKIEGELQERIARYFEYQWMNRQFIDETKALACLPDKLEAELAMRVHLDTLKRVNIFQDVEPGLLADLVLKLKLEIYSPGDYICRKGDIGKEMYIVKHGQLEVVADDGRTVFATLGQGSVFGEISILNIIGIKSGNRRTANVRSLGYSDLFCLSKEALWDALREYPEAKKKMLERGKQMLLKDLLLDEKAADENEIRQMNFLDKVERVEKSVDDMQTRFGRLIAEEASSLNKMRLRVSRLNELVNLQMQHYR